MSLHCPNPRYRQGKARGADVSAVAAHGRVRMPRLLVGLLPVFAAIAANNGLAQEIEPNDTLATATATGLVGIGTVTIEGAAIGNGNWGTLDVDIYSFIIDDETPLPVFVTIDVVSDGDGLDAFVRLFHPDGREHVNNDDRSFDDFDPLVRTYILNSGTHYVGVSSTRNPHYDTATGGSGMPATVGPYALTITTELAALPESPYEPNDPTDTPTFMGTGSFTVAGEFIGDGINGYQDVDVYHVELLSVPVRFDVEISTASIGSVLAPIVVLRKWAGVMEAPTANDWPFLGLMDGGPDGLPDGSLSIGIPDQRTSTYYTDVFLYVSGIGHRAYTTESEELGSVGFYDLAVTVTYADGLGINEPNDSIVLATDVEVLLDKGSVLVEGVIGDGPYAHYRADRDYYRLALPTSGSVTVDVHAVDAAPALDPVISVFDGTGNRIETGDNFGSSLDAHVEFALPCNDVDVDFPGAYVMVAGAKERPPGNPLVPDGTLFRHSNHLVDGGAGSTGAYELTITATNGCGGESDDTLATATDTEIGGDGFYVCGGGTLGDDPACSGPGLDVDMWSLDVTHVPALLTASLVCGDNLAQDIRVLDESGAEIALSITPVFQTPTVLKVELAEPGTYFVAVSSAGNDTYDPTMPCSGTGGEGPTTYDIIITLEQTLIDNTGSVPGGSDAPVGRGDVSELFATRLSDAANTIDVLDPMTGDVTASFPAPEPIFSGAEAITSDGESLYYMGIGRYPNLYRMNPSTGDVLDEYILWSGSGFYSDAAVMGNELFVTDYMDRAVHVFDLSEETSARTLDVGLANGITIGGGLAAMAAPPRLYVADAFNTGAIFEVHPQTGAIVAALPAPPLRPTALGAIANELLFVSDWQGSTVEVLDRAGQGVGTLTLDGPIGSMGAAVTVDFLGDFDADGDIDLLDVAAFIRCFTGLGEPLGPGCAPGDFDENGSVDALDVAAFGAGLTGP